MAFKIPKNRKELASMSQEDQTQVGNFLGRLLAHDPAKFEAAVGMPPEEYGALFGEETAIQPQTVTPEQQAAPSLMTQAAKTMKQPKAEVGEPEKFKMDVRHGQKIPMAVEDNGVPGPFDLIFIKKPGGEEEVSAYGTRAKEFLR